MQERIVVVDFGSQFTQLIARRLRELQVYCQIWPVHGLDKHEKETPPSAYILSGGPASVSLEDSPALPPFILAAGVPVLGICYGLHAISHRLGAFIEPARHREFGRAEIDILEPSVLFDGIAQKGDTAGVWMSHGDNLRELPPGFINLASSSNCPYAAIGNEQSRIFGVQFHPEVYHTEIGKELLSNFCFKVCGLKPTWTMGSFEQRMIGEIREKVGDGKVLCALSGGVDSSVTALLIHEAIAENLVCVFVDTGLLRKNEAKEVTDLFRDHFNIPLIHVEAADIFLKRLEGVSDPETKRKIIGRTFIEIFEEESSKIGHVDFLAQGTLYPDVIESVSFKGPSVTIKSHHNVGGLPETMKLALLEPLRELFKDEVRRLGQELGLKEWFIKRHPFPGPGLAVRILGEITAERIETLQEADAIFIEELRQHGLYDEIWQAFAVLLPVKTVGVMGDGRTYEAACALRAVTSQDGMTADVYHFDVSFLSRVATRIVNEVRGINRVTYDITSKPPGTIEWE